jgi:glycosyltransferase involved in cell wall biosynthesis
MGIPAFPIPLNSGPLFTVIMATWGRGSWIVPSIRSVLQQDMPDFELLVVGDACTDDTEQAAKALADPRIQWINLDTRHYSQSGPNNEGLQRARGHLIAYLGHDDLWEPEHLSSLASLFRNRPTLGFAVGGMVLHMPPGVPGSGVAGMLQDESQAFRHFFPPSCIAHRCNVPEQIGPWRNPSEISAPVDADFEQRAFAAGITFGATGRITVHKFTASTRYLSYAAPSSEEQEAMLLSFRDAGHAARISAIVDAAKAGGTFMTLLHVDYDRYPPGELARRNRVRKGVEQTLVRNLIGREVIVQEPSNCALDWIDTPIRGIRWARINPSPRILLPYTCDQRVSLCVLAYHRFAEGLGHLVLHCNGERHALSPVKLVKHGPLLQAEFSVSVVLQQDCATILRFELGPDQIAQGKTKGIGLGEITLVPEPVPG